MENEPREQPNFKIDNFGEILDCTPENTYAYLYEDPDHDHIYFVKEETDDGLFGYHIFRHSIKNFDNLISFMDSNEFTIFADKDFTEDDQRAFDRSTSAKLANEYQNRELTEHQKHKLEFLHYILEKELLIDDDFKGKGDLYI